MFINTVTVVMFLMSVHTNLEEVICSSLLVQKKCDHFAFCLTECCFYSKTVTTQ